MLKLTLPDLSVREIEDGLTAGEVITGIGSGLYKAACCCRINGIVADLRTPITEDSSFEVLTFDSKEGKETFWHTASHIMAEAVKELYPDAKLARGPATENGFYYDFEVAKPFTMDDLSKIETKTLSLAKEGRTLTRFFLDPDKALQLMTQKNEHYKVELISKHEGEALSFYQQGDFIDLCAGPHLMNTAPIKAIKLLSCTGAYWGAAEDGKMLSRIYGTAFPKASMLDEHLKQLEEAKLRDHNKLGRELEYFTTVDCIGQGLPILLPKGAKVIQILQRFVEDEEAARGYLLTKTPLMAKSDLYKISGHWDHYKEGMFVMGEEGKDKEVFALRPMTCPFQYQVFLNRQRSYKELPMRLGETSTLFRNEDSGEMHGLIRVRQFTISEGHIILRPEQLKDEFKDCVALAKYMLDTIGLGEDVSYRFSKWDPNNTAKYIGTAQQWDEAQGTMEEILNELGLEYSIGIDEAAFYGPKLDIQIKNVFGKEDTLITIQIDQMLAEKFGMEYIDTDGTKRRPYIIHRTSLGCYERTLALLIEKYAGAFPLWLAPLQVKVLPISDAQEEYAYTILKELNNRGIRAEIDSRNEKIGYKIRAGKLDKTPVMLVIGDKEQAAGTVAFQSRRDGDLGAMPLTECLDKLSLDILNKVHGHTDQSATI